MDVITILDFTVNIKKYDLSVIDKVSAPKLVKNVWECDLSKILPPEVKSIISIYLEAEDESKSNISLVLVAEKQTGEVSIH